MRILLIGEYSRLHNSLKEGLQSLGHDVIIIGSGDAFKNYPVDIFLKQPFSKGLGLIIKKIVYKTFKIDLTSSSTKKQFENIKKELSGFDYVQLINENALNTIPKIETKLLNHIFNTNKNVYLLSCGTDYTSVNFAKNKGFKYSILNPYNENRVTRKSYWHVLKYLTNTYKNLHEFVFQNTNGVIASDLDYHLPLLGNKHYLGLIPNPINSDKIRYIEPIITDTIIIFFGVNRANYIKKGGDYFDKAIAVIERKFSDRISIIKTENLPYDDYIKSYNKAHIVLDQVYAYDQGYNALEAMAKGKVVFTGAEQEWLDYYGLEKNTVAINALPNAQDIADKLEWLIENPQKISDISKNARAFIEKEHHYITIAKKYLEIWKTASKN
jgi:glycosyltransferase involved in cell wall biosynthesis